MHQQEELFVFRGNGRQIRYKDRSSQKVVSVDDEVGVHLLEDNPFILFGPLGEHAVLYARSSYADG